MPIGTPTRFQRRARQPSHIARPMSLWLDSYVHGEPVADYVRRSTNPGDCEVTYRLMSDGVLLQQTAWPRREARSKRATYKSRWKIAKVTPEIRANPDLLLTHGFQKE